MSIGDNKGQWLTGSNRVINYVAGENLVYEDRVSAVNGVVMKDPDGPYAVYYPKRVSAGECVDCAELVLKGSGGGTVPAATVVGVSGPDVNGVLTFTHQDASTTFIDVADIRLDVGSFNAGTNTITLQTHDDNGTVVDTFTIDLSVFGKIKDIANNNGGILVTDPTGPNTKVDLILDANPGNLLAITVGIGGGLRVQAPSTVGHSIYKGELDANAGSLPATAQVGDWYYIGVGGTNFGNIDGVDTLSVADKLIYLNLEGDNDPSNPQNWTGYQRNTNDAFVGFISLEDIPQTKDLVANTPLAITPVVLATGAVRHITVLNSAGEDITSGLTIIYGATPTIESGVALTDVVINMSGVA